MKHTEKIWFHMHLNTHHHSFHTIILELSQTHQNLLKKKKVNKLSQSAEYFNLKNEKNHLKFRINFLQVTIATSANIWLNWAAIMILFFWKKKFF